MRRGPGPLFRVAWGFLAVVSVALILYGGYIFYAPTQATFFAQLADGSFDSLRSSDPGVADYIVLMTRLLAVTAMGLGTLSLFVTWFGVRDRSPLSINVMWTLPLLAAALALTFILEGANMAAIALAGVTVLLALSLVIARRTS